MLVATPRDPQYFDLQVNGYAGIDFNADQLSGEELHRACQRLVDDGVAGILATVITAPLDEMERRLRRLATLREADILVRQVVWGLHVEGPFISSAAGFVGAHPVAAVQPASVDTAARLLDAGGGLCRLFTLAPEQDPDGRVIRYLRSQNIIVSAGHCDPSRGQLQAAIDAGLTMFTHLGNGCPMLLHRHDNVIQRALSFSDQLWCCFIADGVHVPFFALRNYLQIAGVARSIVVTDAIAAAGMGPGRFTLGRQPIVVGHDLAARFPDDDSHLAGSAITMPATSENLRDALGLDEVQITRLTATHPRQALNLGE